MNSGTPVSIPPGPLPSLGISRATAALMNRHSSAEKNDGTKSAFLVSFAAATEAAERLGRMAAGARPRINFRLFNISERLDRCIQRRSSPLSQPLPDRAAGKEYALIGYPIE